ncbi:MAG: class I SAM-dependent RNA methyltransferase [Candidatus Omnitrophica bacterium]|nr:class I SAM-dependent RNA methyltransferase [Candidatus Omnitrophota bacterium]
MDFTIEDIVLITCARGLVPYLITEVEALGYEVQSTHDTGLEIRAAIEDTQKLNLYLRTAFNVLYLLKKFTCTSPDELYREVSSIAWEEIIDSSEYLSIAAVTSSDHIKNSIFASQKTKDAIVDGVMKKCGSRPDSGAQRDNVALNLYWKDDTCWLYLNTSGKKLSDRTYRKIPFKAPLQETLAAAIIQATGYDGSLPLVNPMCGSGTLAIEAALIALKRYPGLLRSNFGFIHVKGFNKEAWVKVRKAAHAGVLKKIAKPIIATDIDPKAIDAAKKNAQTAGVDSMIDFQVCDFRKTPVPTEKGIIVLNPEYGFRMGDEKKLEETYKEIGDFFKQVCAGYKGYIFTGNLGLGKKVGLRTSRKLIFYNARIECRLLEYNMYEGTVNKL